MPTTCTRCDHDRHPNSIHALCPGCLYATQLADALDDGTGRTAAALAPLHQLLLTRHVTARGALSWLNSNPHVGDPLRGMARGAMSISHQTLDAHPSPRTAAHMRDLLIQAGLLEPRDRHLAQFEAWLAGKLAAIIDPGHQQLIRRFATWRALRQLRRRAETRAVEDGETRRYRQEINVATDFLAWLAEQGATPKTCRQAHLDAWLATGPTTRIKAGAFLRWATESHEMPAHLKLAQPILGTGLTISQDDRLSTLRRILEGTEIPLQLRAAGTLLMLYAQPISRISQLPLDALSTSPTVTIALGSREPADVPSPFAEIFHEFLASPRTSPWTAANAGTPWMFPGLRPGHHIHPTQLRNRLRDHGIHLLGARTSALHALIREIPPAVVAQAIGYTDAVIEKHSTEIARPWATYASYRRQEPSTHRRNTE
ncbi:MAG: recombinase XerD [Actinocrinis sp.]